MRYLIAMLCIALTVGFLGCRLPSLEVLVRDTSEVGVDVGHSVCNTSTDLRKEHSLGLRVFSDRQSYSEGDFGYLLIVIKHSSRLSLDHASRKVGFTFPENIDLVPHFGTEVSSYTFEKNSAPSFGGMQYDVRLDEEYKALLRFRYHEPEPFVSEFESVGPNGGLIDMSEYSPSQTFRFEYFHRIPDMSIKSTAEFVLDADGRVLKFKPPSPIQLAYIIDPTIFDNMGEGICDIEEWNTIPDDGTDLRPYVLPRCWTEEEYEQILPHRISGDREAEDLVIRRLLEEAGIIPVD